MSGKWKQVLPTTGEACPLCGISYQQAGIHGSGICVPYGGPAPHMWRQWSEDDIRRIVREELQRAKGEP